MNPTFVVPAEHFYALAAHLPPDVTPETRYRMACLQDERHTRDSLTAAGDRGTIVALPAPQLVSGPGVSAAQSARRLRSLGRTKGSPEALVTGGSDLHGLVQAWLQFSNAIPADDPEQDIAPFWTSVAANPAHMSGHLRLVLSAATETANVEPLITAIKTVVTPLDSVNDLAGLTGAQWHQIFAANPSLLPEFTKPGTIPERVDAFIRHLERFFDITIAADVFTPDGPEPIPAFEVPADNPLALFLSRYAVHAGSGFVFGATPSPAAVTSAAADVFPSDERAQRWLIATITTLNELFAVTDIAVTPELRVTLMESLYARGFTRRAGIAELAAQDFQDALTGTVAFDHAAAIHAKAGGGPGSGTTTPGGALPINPDGSLVNCVPPLHLSPFGPPAYLQELLRLTPGARCDDPNAQGQPTLAAALESRRGPLGDLLVTRENTATPLPLIDIVNECLEAMATAAPGAVAGVVHDTAASSLHGHALRNSADEPGHDPATLFAMVPEHSTSAVPVASGGGYEKLRKAFSASLLPYSQPLDIVRSYLEGVGTSRYAVMRRFRKQITEFVLEPSNEPASFRSHLWRYPVRFDIALEYLGINPEESVLFLENVNDALAAELYGFHAADPQWTVKASRLPRVLEQTGLAYCELYELWLSGIVPFALQTAPGGASPGVTPAGVPSTTVPPQRVDMPACPPCCLGDYSVVFDPPLTSIQGLVRLAVVARLWRKLHAIAAAKYSFAQLRDIAEVFVLFDAAGNTNGDFVRQLAAFQMLRDHLSLRLDDPYETASGTGADRMHLLALWAGPSAAKWDWAVDHLLDQVRHYAVKRHRCGSREPEFLKLLAANLGPLSRLAGFDPATPARTWHARPTHTLRFAEVLAKIYASPFAIGEILFLFTTDPHLGGDDPFPLQPLNEAHDDPLHLPDDQPDHSLWALRQRLLEVSVGDEEAAGWTWDRIEASLREEFGLPGGLAPDPLRHLGEHFFPGILAAAGQAPSPLQRQFRTALNTTSALMWNTPADGPFRYDQTSDELYAEIPLVDESVVRKLARIKPLSKDEQRAVRELYFQPRLALAKLALLFPNMQEADLRLIQEPDEQARWTYFQRAYATFHARAQVTAEHLASHVSTQVGADIPDPALAARLLKHLYADENRSLADWENDNGQVPPVRWTPPPAGGALSALLSLVGTGLVGEFRAEPSEDVVWRETRGPLDAFSPVANEWNAPVIPLIPAMSLTLSAAQLTFAGIRNGFALTNPEGAPLSGAQGFRVTWRGVLVVETAGVHTFFAGSPTPDGEEPALDCAEHQQWRITLTRGQRTYIVLSHRWPGEEAPPQGATPMPLRRGAYDITVEFVECAPEFDDPEDITRQKTGFQVKYSGPDTGDRIVAIPADRLFVRSKDHTLAHALAAATDGTAREVLVHRYLGTLRDARRTYERAFKAVLFASRFGLSAAPVADDLQSEIGYLLDHAEDFSGLSFFEQGGAYQPHRAWLNFNFLPVDDNHVPPTAAQDSRSAPSVRRQQAMFDWWERIFDYTDLRTRAGMAPERPAWLLFHEAAEGHPDDPAHALRHIGVDLSHGDLVRKYYKQFALTSSRLEDEQWAVRVWRADEWIEQLRAHFTCVDVREARPDLWASDDPGDIEAPETESGNLVLTRFIRNGCIENEGPRRYTELTTLNNGLRERGRDALLAYLSGMDRVALPWGGHATTAKHLSELLLLDVEAGGCQRASRIEEAITAVQSFVQRARLGLEPAWVPEDEFALLWDRRFATYNVWQLCKRREMYSENWIEWEEIERARASESFRFLEDRLRSAALTVPAAAGFTIWEGGRPPAHPGVQYLQVREPSTLMALSPPREGFSLLGTEERHARPSWLSSPGLTARTTTRPPVSIDSDTGVPIRTAPATAPPPGVPGKRPWWIEAAVRLGAKFVRVAAAGEPMGAAMFQPEGSDACVTCCAECGVPHPPVVDEYYFWLMDSRHFERVTQDAHVTAPTLGTDTPWHDEMALPKLLHWKSTPMVHLVWSRVHNGELKQTRRSHEGVQIAPGTAPDLVFTGRLVDSLYFEVTGGVAPAGVEATPGPGFRYDLPVDAAEVLPPVVAPPAAPGPFLTTFPAYPYFLYFTPGAPLVPLTTFSQSVTVARWLRAHCRYEAALKWLDVSFSPLREDARWCHGERRPDLPPPTGDQPPAGTVTGTVVLVDGSTGNAPSTTGSRRRRRDGRRDTSGTSDGPPSTTAIVVPPRQQAHDPCCRGGKVPCDVARDRAITLLYLETLIDWVDALMRRNTPEAFHQARLLVDAAIRITGATPLSIHDIEELDPAASVEAFTPLGPALNPRLLNIYERLDDRLAMIHACLNARRLKHGTPDLDMPYFGDSPLREGWQTSASPCADDGDWCLLPSPYRFTVLVSKALELANEVRAFGAALLSAFEKGDAEYLASLRAAHERQLLTLALSIRQNAWREADWQVQALRKTKEIAQTRRAYYQLLIDNGLNGGEIDYRDLTTSSTGVRAGGNVSEAVAQLMHLVPDVYVGTVNFAKLPVGSKLASVFSAVARIANTVADILATTGSVRLTEGGWDRREDEWRHQVEVLDIEIEQIERQILASERRRDIALRELNNHQRQIEQAAEIQDFLRDKFTSHELYLWLQRETTALHYQMFELASQWALRTQRAFNYERGYTTRRFLPHETWDDLHEGLLAGERLALALRQMEGAYLEENVREYELTKHISVRQLFPLQFLQLKLTGACEISIPEWLFDLDYPGHYMRRIKNVTMTIPVVVGPHAGVHCRLTLLSSITRIDPRLREAVLECCEPPAARPALIPCQCGDEDRPAAVGPQAVHGGYEPGPDDPRFVRQYAACEAIATSSGQMDSGLFELNFRDERYLPFEFAGAVSRWRIELPPENNYFDMESLTECVLHFGFTAREGGTVLRDAAREAAAARVPGDGRRVLDIRNEMPDAWHRFRAAKPGSRAALELRLSRALFAYLPGRRDLHVTTLGVLVETEGTCEPDLVPAHHTLTIETRPPHGCKHEHDEPCVSRTFECVSNAAWPGLHHGTVPVDLGPVRDHEPEVVTLRFPSDMPRVMRVFVMLDYEARDRCAAAAAPR